jgi:hypothetical protein
MSTTRDETRQTRGVTNVGNVDLTTAASWSTTTAAAIRGIETTRHRAATAAAAAAKAAAVATSGANESGLCLTILSLRVSNSASSDKGMGAINLSNVDKAAHKVLVAELSDSRLRLLPCSIFHNTKNSQCHPKSKRQRMY